MRNARRFAVAVLLASFFAVDSAEPVFAQTTTRDQVRRQIRLLEARIQENGMLIRSARRDRKDVARQISENEKTLANLQKEIKTAEKEADVAKNGADAFAVLIDAAEKAVKEAADRLTEVEEGLEGAQPSDSPFFEAKVQYEVANSNHQKAVDAVLESPEYKAAYKEAVKQKKRLQLARLREKALEGDAEVKKTKGELKEAKALYQSLRRELLEGSNEWIEADDAVAAARKSLAELKKRAPEGANRPAGARDRVTKAQRRAASIEKLINRAKAQQNRIDATIRQIEIQRDNDRRLRDRLRLMLY